MKIPIISSALNWAYHQVGYYTQSKPSAPSQQSTLSGYRATHPSKAQIIWSMLKKVGRFFLSLLSFFRQPTTRREVTQEPPPQQVNRSDMQRMPPIPETNVQTSPLINFIDQEEATELKSLLQHSSYRPYLETIKPEIFIENFDKIKDAISLAENKNRENRFEKKQIDKQLVGPIIIFTLQQINQHAQISFCYCLSADIILEELIMHYHLDIKTSLKMILFKIAEQLFHYYNKNALKIYIRLSSQHIDSSIRTELDKQIGQLILTNYSLNSFDYGNFVNFLSDDHKVNLYLFAWEIITHHPEVQFGEEDKRTLKELSEIAGSQFITGDLRSLNRAVREKAELNRQKLLSFLSRIID